MNELVYAANFDDFYVAHGRRAVALAFALCGDRGTAEEIAHDAFIEAFRQWERIGRFEDPAAWLRQVIANRSMSRWRRLGREAKAIARLSSRREPVQRELGESSARFWELVRSLPTRQAQAIALHYAEDLPVSAIAAALGCSENTVKAHLFKGRRSLAAALGAEIEDEC